MIRFSVSLLALIALAAVGMAGCADDDSNDAGTSRTPSLEAAIEAIEAGDADALASQVVFNDVACTTVDGLGGPPKCGSGQADGTEVTVFPSAACEGYYVLETELAGTFEAFVAAENEIHAIYETGGLNDFIAGDYVILLAADDPQFGRETAREVYVDQNGITGLFFGCGQGVEELIDAHGLTDEVR